MKLGSETGSLVNHVMADNRTVAELVKPGDGATLLLWSDRHAYTVVEVLPGKVGACRDRAIRNDDHGMSDSQEYRYERNPDSGVEWFKLHKDGRYHSGGIKGPVLIIGYRDHYFDFSF